MLVNQCDQLSSQVALDSYNDWFAHYHHKKPAAPSMPSDANFHERVRFEHEHKEYEVSTSIMEKFSPCDSKRLCCTFLF